MHNGPFILGLLAAGIVACLLLLPSGEALAQAAFERHIPELPEPAPVEIAPPPLIDPAIADDEPLGVDLQAVVFLGPLDPVLAAAAEPIDVARVPRLDDPEFRARVAAYLGQPISRRLIVEIEAAVAEFYREVGFPFVAVSTPPQEITAGIVQFRVVEFRAGAITVSGARRATPDYVLSRIRLEPGEEIEARLLAEDLEWLNRNPFRTLQAVFSPGERLGETDLDIRVSEVKPWQVFAGYANAGSAATGRDRYFVGASLADVPFTDVAAAYQLTASPDFWYDDGTVFGNAGRPRYVSHAGLASIPVAPRQEIELIVNHVASREASGFFDVDTRTSEVSAGHRSALSNVSPLPGDIIYGIEARQQRRDIFFADERVAGDKVRIYQGFLGWEYSRAHAAGLTMFNGRGHFSPGNLDRHNSDEAFAAMTAGRLTSSRYAYATAGVEHRHAMPLEFTLVVAAVGQVASGPLPETEKLTIGGAHAVRGYWSDDDSYDWGGYIRNELRLPATPLPLGAARGFAIVQPFAFLDAGHGADRSGGARLTAASLGAGLDAAIGANASGTLAVARALRTGPFTRKGDLSLQARVVVRY